MKRFKGGYASSRLLVVGMLRVGRNVGELEPVAGREGWLVEIEREESREM